MHGKIRLLNFLPFYDGGLFQLHPKKGPQQDSGILNDSTELYTHIFIRDRAHQGQVRSMTADDSIRQRFLPHQFISMQPFVAQIAKRS